MLYYLGWKLAVPSSRPFLWRPPHGSYRRLAFSFSLSRHSLIRKKSSIAILEQRLLADLLKTAAAIEHGYAPLRFKSQQGDGAWATNRQGESLSTLALAVHYVAIEILLSITTTWFRNPLHLRGPWMAPCILDRCELAGL